MDNLSGEILTVLQSGESDIERLMKLRIVFNKIVSEYTNLSSILQHSIERAIESIDKMMP
jgi:lipopolysaccharide biosynthesis protein